jgi:glutathione peroxidase
MMSLALVIVVFLGILLSTSAFFGALKNLGATSSKLGASGFYDLVEKDSAGKDVKFDKFKGKVVYGVNVASKCGYTASGYKLLEKISAMDGAEVLLFPCNQFGGQEPGTSQEIESFCAMKNVKGANIFEKADVNGPSTRPAYKFLKDNKVIGDVAWNFAGKFLVDKEGKVMPVRSESDLLKSIQKELNK